MKNLYSDSWSPNEALGDTIMEKYESLYIKLMHMFNELGGNNHIICGPEIADIFRASTSSRCQHEDLPFAKVIRINNRFDVYVDKLMKVNHVYVFGQNGIKKLIIKDFLTYSD